MPNADDIKAFLLRNRGSYFCDGCLSNRTGIEPANQVNQLTRPLRGVPPYRFGDSVICSECRQERKCIRHN